MKCRGCGTTDPRRFRALARTECDDCKAARKSAGIKKPRVVSTPRPPAASLNPHHLAWVRTLRCACPGCRNGTSHAHHVRTGNTGGGMGKKPPDRWAVPLCPCHHRELHDTGQRTFEAKYGLDLKCLAESLASESPHIVH